MPVSEALTNTEVNPLQEMLSETNQRKLESDPEKISQEISRALCEPTEELYKRNRKLQEDPIAANESVNLINGGEEEIKNPAEGLVVAAAKLETAKNELNLSAKQKETFNGFKENIHGAAAFLKGARGKAARVAVTRNLDCQPSLNCNRVQGDNPGLC